jgi:hypothetical protein
LRSGIGRIRIAVFPPPAVVVRAAELAVVGVGVAAPGPGLDVVALAALCRHVAALVSAATIEDVEGPAHGSGETAGTSEVDDPRGTVEHHPLDERLASSEATVPGVTTVRSASSHTRPLKVS